MRSDHSSNSILRGVCIYYKKTLPLTVINVVSYLNEYKRFKLKIGQKLCSFIIFYRSPSQTRDEMEEFKDNLELNLDLADQNNPYLAVILGNFNAS